MKHIRIEIVANEYQQEELIALLDDYSPTGFEQTDEKLIAFFTEDDFVQEGVQQLLQGYPHEVTEVAERNWNEEWESSFSPVVVDDFVAVRAHFHAPVRGVEHEVVITPKMSFGTGHHATTFLMMQAMRKLDFRNKSVFDFGTGTGVLAILSAKLGASAVTAIDVDNWSLENAAENATRNGCEGISLSLSSNIPDRKFDILLANINRNVLLDYMPLLRRALSPKACVLFSGLLRADEEVITGAAEIHGLQFQGKAEKDGWLSLLFVNSG